MLDGSLPPIGASEAAPKSNKALLDKLASIVGARHVLTTPGQTLRFRRGFRFGLGNALAVVQPGSLVEQWRVLQACVAGRHDCHHAGRQHGTYWWLNAGRQ